MNRPSDKQKARVVFKADASEKLGVPDVLSALLNRIRKYELLTPEQQVDYSQKFSRHEIATHLLDDLQTGVRDEKGTLKSSALSNEKNPPLAKGVAQALLADLGLAEAIGVTEEVQIKKGAKKTKEENNEEKKSPPLKSVVGYAWREDLASDKNEVIASKLQGYIDEADAAKEAMIERNLPLVVNIAKRYSRAGLEFIDVISVGSLGLTRAVEKFDGRRGIKFSTHADWWIRESIKRELSDTAKLIQLPREVYWDRLRVIKTKNELENLIPGQATPEEIAEKVNVDTGKAGKFDAKKVVELLGFKDPTSLDIPLGDGSSTVGDFIEDSGKNTDDAATEDMPGPDVEKLFKLANLSDGERVALRGRFRFYENRILTYAEIGKEIGYSKERARQLMNSGMKKLQAVAVDTDINEFLLP